MCTRYFWSYRAVQVTCLIVCFLAIWLAYPHPNQHIINAIQRGDADSVHLYIDQQITSKDVRYRHIWTADDIRLGYDRTPLAVASKYCQPHIVKMLLYKYDSDPNLRNSVDQASVLFTAAGYDTSGECLKLLLEVPNVDIESMSKSDWTPLFNAILFSNVRAVAMLLRAGADPHHAIDTLKMGSINALHFAFTHSTHEIAKMLIDKGAYIHAQDRNAQHYDKYIMVKNLPWNKIKQTVGIEWSERDFAKDSVNRGQWTITSRDTTH